MLKGAFKYYTKRGKRFFFKSEKGHKLTITFTDNASKEEMEMCKNRVLLLSQRKFKSNSIN
jgi:hypothetical protein